MLYYCAYMPFQDYFFNQARAFTHQGLFESVQLHDNVPAHWPTGFGVYVVWCKEDGKSERLFYVGLVGGVKRNDQGALVRLNSRFANRVQRWTPYRFAEKTAAGDFRWHFRYGPVHGAQQEAHKDEPGAYQHSIPYSSIKVDFFKFQEDQFLTLGHTPASLEACLLTAYLAEFNDLPPANQKL
jgi:hypothetical protein